MKSQLPTGALVNGRSYPLLFVAIAISAWASLGSTASAGEALSGEVPADAVVIAEPEPWAVPTVDIRPRYEYGDQADRSASHAATLRSRLGLLTREIAGFRFFAEYEGTLVADKDSYQAASVHGLGQNKTIIADPESHELNQLWISYTGLEDASLKAGRQGINIDNQRYVGTVAWRQNMQTLDAAALHLSPVESLSASYTYVNKVNRIFGSQSKANPAHEDFEGNTHLIHVSLSDLPVGDVSVFAYLMDLGNDAGDANSNNSFGISSAGPLPWENFAYRAEYGFQTDAFDSPLDYRAHHVHGALSTTLGKSSSLELGYEYLGSNNGVGYKFPLGTNHKFNGFADKFLATPPDGLQDLYVVAGTKLPWKFGCKLGYHKFYNDNGNRDYGNEIDFVVTRDLGHGFSFLGKYAYYWAQDEPYTDTNRITVQVDYKF